MSTFDAASLTRFAGAYPEVPHKLAHALTDHPLLTFEALADLAEALPPASVEYNLAALPIGIGGKPPAPALGVGETIRRIGESGSWAALKNIEQDSRYAALLDELLAELRPAIEAKTGRMMKPQGFVFVTSPGGVTPYHFDPEHNVLLQVRGTKMMTQFPAGDARFAPDTVHEGYHTGGGRELPWDDSYLADGRQFPLAAGEALFVPVMAPHFVRNGPKPSISLSITWRSDWSFAEADARAFNSVLRKAGLSPRPPGRWPSRNRAKALCWRMLRRIGRI